MDLGRFFVGRKIVFAIGVFLGVVIIGSGISAKFFYDKKWKDAEENYKKADYQKAAANLKYLPMPSDGARLRIYGQTMMATNQDNKASIAFEKLSDKTEDPFAELMLGNIANQQKEYDKAVEIYEHLTSSNPNYIQAYANLAMVYKIQNRTDKAVATAKRGIDANPNSTILHELMVSLTMENKELPEYKNSIEKLKQLDPNNFLLK